MPDILQRIIAVKSQEVAAAKLAVSPAEVEQQA